MFENEKRKGMISSAASFNKISAEEENIVRKNVDPKMFDVEGFIEYLNNHDSIGLDIFDSTVLPDGPRWTYLAYLKETPREAFIKRIPIYFYDLFCEPNDPTMTEFFGGYKNFKNGISGFEAMFREGDDDEEEDFDYEELYQIIDDIVFNYKIPAHLVLKYIYKQIGNVSDYWIFNTWYQYIKLVKDLNEENCFPRNILYSYNVELEKAGELPIVYTALNGPDNKPMFFKSGSKLSIAGYFPTDDSENIVRKWTGIWVEDLPREAEEESARVREVNLANIKRRRIDKPALRQTVRIKLGPDTRVFLAADIYMGENLFGEEEYHQCWEEIYVGPRKMKFDRNTIIQRREELKLSLKEVSEVTDINIRTLQRIESGESLPDGLNLMKLMNVLGISDYSLLVKKTVVDDPDFEKFRTGSNPSEFMEDKGELIIDE